MEQELDRLLERVEAIRRDIAEHDRIVAKYLAPKSAATSEPSATTTAAEVTPSGMTLSALIAAYKIADGSPYKKLRYKTKENYDSVMGRLHRDLGSVPIQNLDAERVQRAHAEWSAGGKIAMGHSLIGMLRILATFGAHVLKDRDCRELRVTLHDLKFKNVKPRTTHLTAEQAVAIRVTARAMNMPSMALAQAIQFDTGLRQKDVIGEFVPVSEPGISDITWDPYGKWLHGIRWNQIDENLILQHVTSSGGKDVEFDLRRAPMVMDELRQMYGERGEVKRENLPMVGPIIINEDHGMPYLTHTFRRAWRTLARAAGVPDDVKNADARGGTKRKREIQDQERSRHVLK